MGSFTINNDKFLLNEKEFKLISGALHYFRVPREYWRDRLEKLKKMGCNTVETYLPWNLHEPDPGEFRFSGDLDVVSFVKLAEELSLYVILRPTPYICGEFEFGGLPWWLLKDRTMRVRSIHEGFCQAVNRYFDRLIPLLSELQISRKGPVLAFQIENEYGSYGNNPDYMGFLKEGLEKRGIEVPLFTSDGPWGDHLEYGRIPGVLQTANFGSGAEKHFRKLKRMQPEKPLVCMEFWMGWFDAWGDEHHTRDAEDAAQALDEILKEGHVNLYMFHGGTNFGFTAGANYYEEYKPDVTSYDYDAPLSEWGDFTAKYHAFQKVIGKYREIPEVPLTTEISKLTPVEVKVKKHSPLFINLDMICEIKELDRAYTMEDLDQGFGYINYRVNIKGTDKETLLQLKNCADRAIIYLDKHQIGVREDRNMSEEIPLDLDDSVHTVDILVENQGRVNFGHKMNDQRKGIDGGLLINGCEIGPVCHYSLPFNSIPDILWQDSMPVGDSGFHYFELSLELPEKGYLDSFLDMRGWGKGIVFVNGRNIGRFWEKGPQSALYLPGPFLRNGKNEIVIFETEGIYRDTLPIIDKAILGL